MVNCYLLFKCFAGALSWFFVKISVFFCLLIVYNNRLFIHIFYLLAVTLPLLHVINLNRVRPIYILWLSLGCYLPFHAWPFGHWRNLENENLTMYGLYVFFYLIFIGFGISQILKLNCLFKLKIGSYTLKPQYIKGIFSVFYILILAGFGYPLRPDFRSEDSLRQGVKAETQYLKESLKGFYLDHGWYPSTAEGLNTLTENPGSAAWKGPYVPDGNLPKDPWGNPFQYELRQDGAIIISSWGRNGKNDSVDDINIVVTQPSKKSD